MKNKVIAILCADIHLSHKPPIWRSNEPNWYAAMQRPLDEIQELQSKYECLVLCAGDIFDLWYGALGKTSAELINWTLEHLPFMYSIVGQHDMPEHNIEDIKRSAYKTLVIADVIKNMNALVDAQIWIGGNPDENYIMSGFPYECKIVKVPKESSKDLFEIAIVHDYIWKGFYCYPNAPKEKHIPKRNNKHMINDKYYGYDVIVYGDNHKGFTHKIGKTTIFNCGTLMRRKSDEVDYKPQVGLLYSDGSVEPHYLDISKDKHLTADEVKEAKLEEVDMEIFAEELRKLGSSALDFSESMKQFWTKNKTPKKVKDLILEAMEK